jgi:prepilin-type N-terminal cleavage/methylation domain-containing protein
VQSIRPRQRPGFTLIELLVVIAVIAILAVAVVPAVKSLFGANGQKGAVSTVMNLFEQARALAVTSGSATYIVFADESTPENYRCKALIVFKDDSNFTPVAVSKWNFLPTGVSFLPATGVLTAQTASPKVKFLCPGTVAANTPLPLPYVKFDPSGMVSAPTDPNILFANMFSGFVTSAGQASYTDKAQQSSQKFDSVVVARFTGRAHYVDPYSG